MTRSPRRSGLEGGTQVGDQTAVVFARSKLTYAMTLIRLLLILNFLLPPDMSEWLYSANLRSVLIDPIFTIEHVKEAAAVRHLSTASSNFVDAYRGHSSGNSRIHAPPLVLVAFESMLLHIPNDIYWQHVVIAIFLLLVDFWIAGKLEELAANVLQREDPREVELLKKMDPRILPEMAHIFPSGPPATETSTAETLIRWHDLPLCIAQLYYCNPVTVVAGSGAAMSCCFQNLRLAFLVTALAESSSSFRKGVEGSAVTTAFALAVASYLDLHCVVFIVPTVIWHGGDTKAKTFGVLWDVFTIALQGLSTLLVGLDNYASIFRSTHLHQYRLKGLAPSLTTVWYFSMEVFMRFRVYFEFLLAGLPYLLVFPVTIRLRRYPAALVAIFWFLGVLFRPPGTLYDLNVGFCFMLMSPRSLARIMQIPSLVALCALPIPVILYMVGYWMWLEPGNGEANYLYFQCLAYGVFVAILFLNFCSASLRRDKAMRLTEKSIEAAERVDKASKSD